MSVRSLADQHNHLIESNRREYGDDYSSLNFPAPGSTLATTLERHELLLATAERVELGCGGTKLDMRNLSPGCRICVAGEWSCLFINGRCNARCFYCPSRQDETGLPTTNAVAFRSPADYVAYLGQFGFRGMSLSGGEPLLTPGRSLAFLSAAKKHFGDRLHTWLYTNGILVDRDVLLRLSEAGLDEIRFDIGAVGYSLEKLRLAVDLIPTVTVEIPAVPEDLAMMKLKMVEMAEAGVKHLNLHQLRLTPYSLQRFSGRPYTYLHGEKVTVLESELTALELIRHGLDAGIDLPVNYCSFVYKNRYQKAAARRRSAVLMRKPFETLTSAGYLRTLSVTGNLSELCRLDEELRTAGCDPVLWSLNPSRQKLSMAAELWSRVERSGLALDVSYAESAIREHVSYRNPFREIKLPSGRKITVERWTVQEIDVPADETNHFVMQFLQHGNEHALPHKDATMRAHGYECIVEGLQEYF